MLQSTEIITKKKEIVCFFINKNILLNPTILEKLNDQTIIEKLYEVISTKNIEQTEIQENLSFLLSNNIKKEETQLIQEKQK